MSFDSGPLPALAAGLSSADVSRSRNRCTPTIQCHTYHQKSQVAELMSFAPPAATIYRHADTNTTSLRTDDIARAQPTRRAYSTFYRDAAGTVNSKRTVDPNVRQYSLPKYKQPAQLPTIVPFTQNQQMRKPSTLHVGGIERAQTVPRTSTCAFRNSMDVSDINGMKRSQMRSQMTAGRTSRSLECQDIIGPRKHYRSIYGAPTTASTPGTLEGRWAMQKQLSWRSNKGREFGRLPKSSTSTLFGEVPRKTVLQRPIAMMEFSPGHNYLQQHPCK